MSQDKTIADAVMIISDLIPSLILHDTTRRMACEKALAGDLSDLYIWERNALKWLAEHGMEKYSMNAWTARLLRSNEANTPVS